MSATEQAVENLLNEEDWTGKDLQRRLGRRAGDGRDDRAGDGRGTRDRRSRERGVGRCGHEVGGEGAARLGRDAAERADRDRAPGRRDPRSPPRGDRRLDGSRKRLDPTEGRRRGHRLDRPVRDGRHDHRGRSRAGARVADPGPDLDRAPAAARGRRRDHAVELPARARNAFAWAGTRPREHRGAQGRPQHTRHRAASSSPACSKRLGCPPASCTSSAAGPRSGRRSSRIRSSG